MNDERLAGELARRFLSLRRCRGVPWLDRDGLKLLGRVPARPANADGLAAAFLDETLPGPGEAAARLAAALLGRRARRAPADRYTLRGWLAAPLLPFFDAAADDELPCPVLAALSGRAARGPMGAVPADERDAIRRAAEATAIVYGP